MFNWLTSTIKNYTQQPLWFQLSLVLVVLLALALRLYPGHDRIIWNNNDFARDAYTVRKMVAEHDIKLLGPRAEIYSPRYETYVVYAGPIFYYFLAPWYALSGGDPNLPMFAFAVLHVSGMIPLGLLAYRLFKSRPAVVISLLLFAVSYEQIEYARWMLNPCIAIPWLSWMFLFLWETLYPPARLSSIKKANYQLWAAALLGAALGLSIQSEIAVGYWAPFLFLTLLVTKQKLKTMFSFMAGAFVLLTPFLISELKYNFRMTQSFIFDFLLLHATENSSTGSILGRWHEHWGLVAKHVLFGADIGWSFILLCLLLAVVVFILKTHTAQRRMGYFLLFLFIAPSVIYFASFVNKLYVDGGLAFPLILLTTMVIENLRRRWPLVAYCCLALILIAQLRLLHLSVVNNRPFDGYTFLSSENFYFSQKMAIADRIYQEAGVPFFSLSIMDAPYGIPSMWASVFEQYARRTGVRLPNWYGWYAWDNPGDQIFNLNGEPEEVHVVLRPKSLAVDKTTEFLFYQDQNAKTEITKVFELHNYQIEIRKRKPTPPKPD